jgi:hypothetical protein
MDEAERGSVGKTSGRRLLWADGKLYFSRQSERRFYFFLTLVMGLIVLASKAGLF